MTVVIIFFEVEHKSQATSSPVLTDQVHNQNGRPSPRADLHPTYYTRYEVRYDLTFVLNTQHGGRNSVVWRCDCHNPHPKWLRARVGAFSPL